MTTTIYQKFISRFAETFTLIEMTEGTDFAQIEIVPALKVNKLGADEFDELLEELRNSDNEKASWGDGNEPFEEEDARAAYHQKWDEINSDFDKLGI